MKTIKKTPLFAILLLLATSCISDSPVYMYCIAFSFKDTNGIDLVSPLADEKWQAKYDHAKWYGSINPDKYVLDIIPANPYIFETDSLVIRDTARPYFTVAKYDDQYSRVTDFKEEIYDEEGYYYLQNRLTGRAALSGFQDKISYLITCSLIFGDTSAHEIITYWEEDQTIPESSYSDRFPVCVSAVIDGKEVKPTKSNLSFYCVDIVLDK